MEQKREVTIQLPERLFRELTSSAFAYQLSLESYITNLLSAGEHFLSIIKVHNSQQSDPATDTEEENKMGQGKETGRRANEKGRLIAQGIAKSFNSTLEPGSNKCLYRDKWTVIKSASPSNSRFAITISMFDTLDYVLIAKEIQPKRFDMYLTDISALEGKGNITGKVINFNVADAIAKGESLGQIEIDYPDYLME